MFSCHNFQLTLSLADSGQKWLILCTCTYFDFWQVLLPTHIDHVDSHMSIPSVAGLAAISSQLQ